MRLNSCWKSSNNFFFNIFLQTHVLSLILCHNRERKENNESGILSGCRIITWRGIMDDNRKKALVAALGQIEKQFGKG